jgi:hypothetical protein
MPILTPSRALLIGFIVAPGLFLLCAYLTRASRRHILGAMVGASLYAFVNYVWDRAAAAFGWWTYPPGQRVVNFRGLPISWRASWVVGHLASLDGASFGAGIGRDLLAFSCFGRCTPLSTITADRGCSRVVA